MEIKHQKMELIDKRKFPKTESLIPVGKKDRQGNLTANQIG